MRYNEKTKLILSRKWFNFVIRTPMLMMTNHIHTTHIYKIYKNIHKTCNIKLYILYIYTPSMQISMQIGRIFFSATSFIITYNANCKDALLHFYICTYIWRSHLCNFEAE